MLWNGNVCGKSMVMIISTQPSTLQIKIRQSSRTIWNSSHWAWWESVKELYYLEDPSVDGGGRVIVRWIFGKWVGWVVTGLIWYRIGRCGGYL